jgi:ribose transport system permease protein
MTATTSTPDRAPARASGRVLPSPVTGQELVLVGVIAVLWVALTIFTPAFLSANSIQSLLVRLAPVGIMAIGMTCVIITAGIDISIAATLMVCAVVIAKLLTLTSMGAVPIILISMALGCFLGLINGLLIAYGRVPAIIITFGTANIFLFIGLRIFNSQTVNGIPSTLGFLSPGSAGRIFGVPYAFILMVVLVALAWVYLRHFPGGRHLYAIGDDEQAAELAGVNVRRHVLSAYALMGLLVGLAACVTIAAGTSTLDQSVGQGQELATIAAVVIGGTSVMGGRGSVLGSVLGALLVQTVATGVTQLDWPTQLTDLFVGIFILVAVGGDLVRERYARTSQ